MKQIIISLACFIAFCLVLHIESTLAAGTDGLDVTNPPDTNIGVPDPKLGSRKCFICNSFFSPTCADHFNNVTWNLEPCGMNVTMCRKMVQEAYYDGTWNVRYIRQCAAHGEVGGDEGRRCVERAGMYRVKMRYCHCDNKDGCNGAPSLTISYALILPLIFLCKYIHKFL